jgi:hypothetical protein
LVTRFGRGAEFSLIEFEAINMPDNTIRSFLVSIGFETDQASQRNFISAIEGATLKANLLAVAIEEMARTVVDKVGVVAESFELNSLRQAVSLGVEVLEERGGP